MGGIDMGHGREGGARTDATEEKEKQDKKVDDAIQKAWEEK
jgi:hypothetical protein